MKPRGSDNDWARGYEAGYERAKEVSAIENKKVLEDYRIKVKLLAKRVHQLQKLID